MPNFFQIPLITSPQSFSIQLAGVPYNMRLIFCGANVGPVDLLGQEADTSTTFDENNVGGWILDISDQDNVPILCGVPLVTGIDLLYQYVYLNFGGALVVTTQGDPDVPPTLTSLGTSSVIYFVTFP